MSSWTIKDDVVKVQAQEASPKGPWSYAPLTPDQARWYWTKPPYSRQAGWDIPSRAQLVRFCDADSEALEACYRARKEELDRLWWQEAAETGEGPAGAARAEAVTDEAGLDTWQSFLAAGRVGEAVGQPVRGGLWEVDLAQRRMTCAYWPEPAHRVQCGTWFLEKGVDWVPLMEVTADELEEAYSAQVWHPEHGRLSQPKPGLKAARVDLQTMTHEGKGMYALIVSPAEMYLCRDDMSSWISRKSGWSATGPPGARLRRCYTPPPPGETDATINARAEAADQAAALTPIDRLVLVVHGIGQNLAGSNIGDDAANVRATLAAAAVSEAGGEEKVASRAEVLPVQWRKHLTLDVDEVAEALMPPGVRSLRGMMHATAVEVLLYLTPVHCSAMLASLAEGMNRQYARFRLRHPDFQGRVSIMAHSLGSVLTYDVLCNQPPLEALPNPNPDPPPSPSRPQQPAAAAEGAEQSAQPPTSAGGEGAGLGSGSGRSREQPSGGLLPEPSLLPLSSADLGLPGANGGGGNGGSGAQPAFASPAAPPLPPGRTGKPLRAGVGDGGAASGAQGDVTDLSCMLSPGGGSPTSPAESWAHRLAEENARLRRELAEARATAAQNPDPRPSGGGDGGGNGGDGDGSSPDPGPADPDPAWERAAAEQEMAALAPHVAVPQLDFAVDQLVCVGSPLGLFLALRHVDPKRGRGLGTPAAARLMLGARGATGDGLPAARRLYHLYHPNDPVAYRIEPLIVEGAEKRRPVFAAYRGGGRRLAVGLQEFGEDFSAAVNAAGARASSALFGGISAVCLGAAAVANSVTFKRFEAKGKAEDEANAESRTEAEAAADKEQVDCATEGLAGGTAIWRLTDGLCQPDRPAAGRLDFVLQTAPTENPWLSAISSHFAYWASPDVGLFVHRAIHGHDVRLGPPRAPPASPAVLSPASSARSHGGSPRDEGERRRHRRSVGQPSIP